VTRYSPADMDAARLFTSRVYGVNDPAVFDEMLAAAFAEVRRDERREIAAMLRKAVHLNAAKLVEGVA
jgi:hypothetical protein